ncbi:MAG: lysylphosphatidylglycerol synthase transmembrane domain-containing protein [bacterium]|jgi:uncharacterized protein (TIRG00374 family)
MNWQQYRRWVLIFFALGMAVTGAISAFAQLDINFLAAEFNYRFLPFILCLAPLNYCLRYVKWRYYLQELGVKVPEGQNILIFIAGLSMTLTPGKVGELLKCYLLYESQRVPITTTAPVVMAERLTDGISMLILASFGAIAYRYGCVVLCGTAGAIILFLIVLRNKGMFAWLFQRLGRLPLAGRLVRVLAELYTGSYILLKPVPLFVAVSLGLFSWTFEGIVLYLAVQAFGAHISFLQAIFIVSFSAIVGALSLLPGGLVAAEGSILGLLLLTGLGKDVAGAATIITRFSTLWLGVSFGIIGLLLIIRRPGSSEADNRGR